MELVSVDTGSINILHDANTKPAVLVGTCIQISVQDRYQDQQKLNAVIPTVL